MPRLPRLLALAATVGLLLGGCRAWLGPVFHVRGARPRSAGPPAHSPQPRHGRQLRPVRRRERCESRRARQPARGLGRLRHRPVLAPLGVPRGRGVDSAKPGSRWSSWAGRFPAAGSGSASRSGATPTATSSWPPADTVTLRSGPGRQCFDTLTSLGGLSEIRLAAGLPALGPDHGRRRGALDHRVQPARGAAQLRRHHVHLPPADVPSSPTRASGCPWV